MKANLFPAKVQLSEHRGSIGSARLEVRVEDDVLRKQVDANFNGFEHVSVKLPLRGGGEKSVDLHYSQSVDPSPQAVVVADPTGGPRHSTKTITQPSGRLVDVHSFIASADDFDLAQLRGKTLTFEVADQRGTVLATAQAQVETLWG